MNEQSPFDPSTLKLPDEITKHNGYYDPEKAKARYEENKALIRSRYAYEKIIGKRRPNGMPNLKKLTPAHKQMISCFVMGMSVNEIAEQFDVAAITVSRVVSDPLAQEYIEEFDDQHKAEFNAMLPLVNEAVRDALRSPGITNRLKGVDRWAKIHRVMNGDDAGESGKNKAQEIHAARFRFLDKVKELAQQEGVIEAEAFIVGPGDDS